MNTNKSKMLQNKFNPSKDSKYIKPLVTKKTKKSSYGFYLTILSSTILLSMCVAVLWIVFLDKLDKIDHKIEEIALSLENNDLSIELLKSVLNQRKSES